MSTDAHDILLANLIHGSLRRPSAPLLVLTATESCARQVNGLSRGAHCVVMGSMIGTDRSVARPQAATRRQRVLFNPHSFM